MSLVTNPIVVGVAVGIPSSLLGYLGFFRAMRVDRVAEQTGIATGRSTELNLALAGMSTLVDNLQEDNRGLREEAQRCRVEIERLQMRLGNVMAECDELAKQLRRLRRKYGDNGDNGS